MLLPLSVVIHSIVIIGIVRTTIVKDNGSDTLIITNYNIIITNYNIIIDNIIDNIITELLLLLLRTKVEELRTNNQQQVL